MSNYNNFIIGYTRSKMNLLYAYQLAVDGMTQGIMTTKSILGDDSKICMVERLCQSKREDFTKELKRFTVQLNGTICYNEDTYMDCDAMAAMVKRHLEILKNAKSVLIPDESKLLRGEMRKYEAVLRAFLNKVRAERLKEAS